MRGIAIIMLMLAECQLAPAQMSFELGSGQQTYVAGQPIPLTWRLYNHTKDSWIVVSHYATPGENQYDQVLLRIEGPAGSRTLYLSGERAASNLVGCRLLSERVLENSFDLARWAKAFSYTLQPGTYSIVAQYRPDAEIVRRWAEVRAVPECGGSGAPKPAAADKVWATELVTPPLSITIR